jgi:dTDP-4-amino-4,6-dideoxygalactose transaminase
MTWKIPLSDIDFDDQEAKAVLGVMRSKWLSMGPVTEQFEEAFARHIGVKHAYAVSSGTAALHLAHRALGISEGDQVITPSLTFVATANAALYCGARPIFADIYGEENLNISPEQILEKITPATKAISLVHFAGYPCDMTAISDIAEDHNLKVIEDAAHAVGASWREQHCGAIGDIGCFSFFANKNLVTGEGGMITTGDDLLADKIQRLRSHGMTTLTWDRHRGHAHSYDVVDLGFNYRINEIASSIGLIQLKKLDAHNLKRKILTEQYRETLSKIPEVTIPFTTSTGSSAYHIFPILLSDQVDRRTFISQMQAQGIQTSIHYPPIHRFTYYQNQFFCLEDLSLPMTEYVGSHEVTLPLYTQMTAQEMDTVTTAVEVAVDAAAGRERI